MRVFLLGTFLSLPCLQSCLQLERKRRSVLVHKSVFHAGAFDWWSTFGVGVMTSQSNVPCMIMTSEAVGLARSHIKTRLLVGRAIATCTFELLIRVLTCPCFRAL